MRATITRMAAILGISALFLAPYPAAAEPPVEIPAGEFIVDEAGVLGADRERVEDAVARLQAEHQYNLYVIYVDRFEDPTDPAGWVQATGTKKGLGRFDLMLAVAVKDRKFNFGRSAGSAVTDEQRDTILQEAVLPRLRDNEWAEAAVDAAAAVGDAVDEAASGGSDGTSSGGRGDSGEASSGGGVAPALLVGGVLAAGGVGTYLYVRSRRRGPTSGPGPFPQADGAPLDPLSTMSVTELRQRAGSLLIAADDAIKSSEQELGFAQAQYGDEAIRPFAEAITVARSHMTESFKLQQQLDDHIPDSEEQQRAWLAEIIRRCEAVNTSLQEHKEDFDSLRKLEKNAPEALAAAQRAAKETAARTEAARATLARLRERYTDAALTQVADNVEQADERLAFVETAARQAQEKLSANETGAAVVAVRAAEESVHQANVLLDAIDKSARGLDEARADLERAVTQAAQDVAQARAFLGAGRNPELAGPVAAAENALNTVIGQQNGRMDPIALLQQLENAMAQLDAALGGIRDQQDQVRRARETLQHAIMSAQAQISGTADFIRARRGGVGSEARTRLAEAERNLDYAVSIQAEDPVTALSYAQQANTLAAQAASMAQSDVEGFGGPGGMGGFGGGGMFGGRGGGGFGGGMSGAILGGILIDSILRGGGHGGGGSGDGGIFGGGGFGGWDAGGSGGDWGGGFGGDAGGSGNF